MSKEWIEKEDMKKDIAELQRQVTKQEDSILTLEGLIEEVMKRLDKHGV